MAAHYDKESFLDFTTTADGSATHTPVQTPQAVIVMIAQNVTSSDLISGVTYGGVTMTRVQTNLDSASEIGRTYIYFLGAAIPTGAQTVAPTVSSGTDAKTWWCVTLRADSNTEAFPVSGIDGDATNPSVTLGTEAADLGMACSVLWSGLNAPTDGTITAGAGYTKLAGSAAGGRDFGTQSACAEYGVKSGASIVVNWTAAVEDCAMSACFVREASIGLPQASRMLSHSR